MEKRVAGKWELADSREGGLGNGYREIEASDVYEFTALVDVEEYLVDAAPGTYRYELFIYESQRGGNALPKDKRVSNTFEVIE